MCGGIRDCDRQVRVNNNIGISWEKSIDGDGRLQDLNGSLRHEDCDATAAAGREDVSQSRAEEGRSEAKASADQIRNAHCKRVT